MDSPPRVILATLDVNTLMLPVTSVCLVLPEVESLVVIMSDVAKGGKFVLEIDGEVMFPEDSVPQDTVCV